MSQPSAASRLENPISLWLRPWALDARSLAVFRIAIAGVLLYDFAHRLTDFSGMYTENSVIPISFVQNYYRDWYAAWGPFTLSAAPWAQGLAFALAFVSAALLLVGCCTRVATVLCWVCVFSVQMRTPCVQSGGDDLLRLLLFWSMFLPLGQRWSVDAWLVTRRVSEEGDSNGDPNAMIMPGSAGFVLQLCLMYWVTAFYKINPVWWSGDALLSALREDQYGTSWGEALLAWPFGVRLLTWAALTIEVSAPLLLMIPWGNAWWRMLNIALFWGMHFTIDLLLYVGLFSPVCMAGWLALLPTEFWNWPAVRGLLVRWGLEEELPSPLPAEKGTAEAMAEMSAVEPPPRSLSREAWRLSSLAWQTVAACALFYVLWWNIDTLDKSHVAHLLGVNDDANGVGCWIMPREVRSVGFRTWLRQYWSMFHRTGNVTTWWSMRAQLADGSQVDPMRGGEPYSEIKPAGGNMAYFKNHRWQKIFRSMTTDEGLPFLKVVTQWHLDQWNASHPPEKQIVSIDVLRGGEWLGSDEELVTKVFLHLPESKEEASGAFARAVRER